jgi:hypothetical protein
MDINQQLTKQEVASILRLGSRAIAQWVNRTDTPAYKNGGRWLCDPDALRAWIDQQSQPIAPEPAKPNRRPPSKPPKPKQQSYANNPAHNGICRYND